MMIYL